MDELKNYLGNIISRNISPEAWQWLAGEAKSCQSNPDILKFNIAFVAMPRKTGKAPATISSEEANRLKDLREGFSVSGWTNDRLSRVWLLMNLDSSDQQRYTSSIENLFVNAEMSELVALYSSLPVLNYQPFWKKRCAEGIRSYIGQVLESIICYNPYGAEQLDESAWNQLVLKAIFTEKPILEIFGLKERMNSRLAHSLSDYAHERWAAHRTVNPLLWMFISPFINEQFFADFKRLCLSGDIVEQQAAALACHESAYKPARELLEQNQKFKSNIASGELTWASIAEQMEKVVQEEKHPTAPTPPVAADEDK